MNKPVLAVSCFVLTFLIFVAVCVAAEEKTVPAPQVIDFFDAKNQGLIEVTLIARDSLNARIQVKNLTDEPLIVNKPFAFGAVPVLAQRNRGGGGMGGMGGMSLDELRPGGAFAPGGAFGSGGAFGTGGSMQFGMGGGSGGGGNQSMGGGMGGGRGGSGGGGGVGGFFNIPPKKNVREDIKTVCLEHGKKEPNSHIKYDVRPINEVVEKPEVALLCAQIGTGQINQDVGQAAVWHVNCGLSWEQLAVKTMTQQGQPPRPYFMPQQLTVAQNAVVGTVQFVKENNIEFKQTKASGGKTSENSDAGDDSPMQVTTDEETFTE